MTRTDDFDSVIRGLALAPPRPPPKRLATALAIGDRLGDRYVIRAFLGEGGMGSVFRALDEKLGEEVALKVVPRALDNVLRDEVTLAQKVTHPHVCRTYDLEDVDGHQFIKMEYVVGETLGERLRRDGKLPIAEALRIARAIADGLSAAHASRIVHRDLKPGNVMLAGERTVLMDFGVARMVAGPIEGAAGTLGYMAPEQLANHEVDERADLYALGCILYEMVAGEPVFGRGSPIELATRHASVSAPDVRRARPETPRWLARAVARLLAKARDERPSGLALLRRGPRSRRWLAVPVAGAAVAAVAIMVVARDSSAWQPVVDDMPVFDENGGAVSISPDGQWLTFDSDRSGTWQVYVMERSTGRAEAVFAPASGLGETGSPRWTRDGGALLFHTGSRPAMVYRQPMAGTPPRAVGPPRALGIGTHADDCGDAIVYVEESPHKWRLVMRADGGATTILVQANALENLTSPRCDSSGRRIAYLLGAPGSADVYTTDRSGTVHRVTTGIGAHGVTFTPDGNSLVIAAEHGARKRHLFEIAADGSGPLRQLTFGDSFATFLDLSRDGRYLALVRDDTSFFPLIREPARRFLTKQRGMFFLPREVDAERIVVQLTADGPPEVATVRIADGAIKRLARGTAPFPARDGRRIYFATEEAPGTLFAIGVDGGPVATVATFDGRISQGLDGPDGQHVLVQTAGEQFVGYRVTLDGRIAREHPSGLVSPAPSGGWRAVTVPGPHWRTELRLVPPGSPLETPRETLAIVSAQVTWLDDHRIGYCRASDGACVIHDLASGAVTSLGAAGSYMATVARDGVRVFDMEMVGRVTHHVITNFDRR